MPTEQQSTPDPNQPNIYHIRIQEHLEEHWQEWFEGLTFTYDITGETVITGEVIDQAQLFGLLKRIRNLGLTLVSVTRANPDGNP